MKSLAWILKSALSPISCSVGWYLPWFFTIYFSCPYFSVHSWLLTVSIFKYFMIKGLIRDILQYLCFLCSVLIFSKLFVYLSIYHFYFWVPYRWICIYPLWFWSVSYCHTYFVNNGRNGDFQDSLLVQIFCHCCDGWIFLYKFCNIAQFHD